MIRDVPIIVAAVGQTAFVLTYATLPFWRRFVSRALMTKSAALMLLLDAGAVSIFVDYPGQDTVETVLFWFVAVAVWVQLAALLHARAQSNDLHPT